MIHFSFDTEEDADFAYYMARECQILWKKRKQFAQGKIQLNVDPDDRCVWTVEECDEMIAEYKALEERLYWTNPYRQCAD